MTFLNSALLAGLAAISLPILIHLFSRRRYKLIDFSSLRFLRKLQRQQWRKIRLRQWLLLLIRTLAILMIAAAFTRPTLTQQFGIAALSTGRTGTAIVIDGSAGMRAKDIEGSPFQHAKETAETVIDLMGDGDQMTIILAQDEPRPLLKTPSSERQMLSKALDDAAPWDGSADLPAAVTMAIETLQSEQDFRSEIFIISDFTTDVSLPTLPPGIAAYFVPVNSKKSGNLAVKKVAVISEIIEPGQPVDIEITLANHGTKNRADVYYSIFLNGTRLGEDVVTIAAQSEIVRQHQVQPEDIGSQKGIIQIEETDALAVDNRAYFCFTVPDRIDALLVGDETSCREIRLAIASQDLIVMEQAQAENWDVRQISKFDVIIFSGPRDFSQAQRNRLIHFVEQGGGVFILPGDNSDLASINRNLLEKLQTPLWGEKIGAKRGSESFLTWRNPDLESALFKGIVRPGSKPSAPRFYKALTFTGVSETAPIVFEDGMPFLTETAFGQGRVILCASSPRRDWSDWAQRGIFAPLIHRIVLRLASGANGQCSHLQVGDDLLVTAAAAEDASAELTFPDGKSTLLPIKLLGQKSAFLHPSLNQVGIYTTDTGTDTYITAVNPPLTESDLIPVEVEEVYAAWFDTGAEKCPPDQIEDRILTSRYGRELWKTALIAGFILLAIESILGSARRENALPKPAEIKPAASTT